MFSTKEQGQEQEQEQEQEPIVSKYELCEMSLPDSYLQGDDNVVDVDFLPVPSQEEQVVLESISSSVVKSHSPPPRAPITLPSFGELATDESTQSGEAKSKSKARNTYVKFRVVKNQKSGETLYVDCIEGAYHLHRKVGLKTNFGWEFMAADKFWRYDVSANVRKKRSMFGRFMKAASRGFGWREKKVSSTDPECVQRLREALEKLGDDTFVLMMENGVG